MSKLAWYWHRLRAMSPGEMLLHARKKLRQRADARRLPDWSGLKLEATGAFPRLPKPEDAPQVLREALRRDADDIIAGRWKAFGHLDLKVDDPPKWHCDYLVGKDLATTESAFKLNHRALPGGADIKLIWELSRWYQLVRLAMAAYVLGDTRAAAKCVEWLEDWVKQNPPYGGWNWTSALESGMRLIQFTWIDALLGAPELGAAFRERLARLRRAILPPHVWFTRRHKSFGSSANNHLLGELAGCIVATVRWPELRRCGTSIGGLQQIWESEVLKQFASDGGNREQASNYQLFSWEFCWQARMALQASGRMVGFPVEERLNHAAAFEVIVRSEPDLWDYGDSDNGFVTPFFLSERTAVAEWHKWMGEEVGSPALNFCLGGAPWIHGAGQFAGTRNAMLFRDSGIAIYRDSVWTLRWDLSPLGYLKTAAHGHLDALHVSLWLKGVALVVDPGTGAYFADAQLRNWLASWAAHNGPCMAGMELSERSGPFLWRRHHARPEFKSSGESGTASLALPEGIVFRSVRPLAEPCAWEVADSFQPVAGSAPREFTVRWQFAPGCWVKQVSSRVFAIHRGEVSATIEVDEHWTSVELVEPIGEGEGGFEGIVSPAFRKTARAPFLKLLARRAEAGRAFTTVFRA